MALTAIIAQLPTCFSDAASIEAERLIAKLGLLHPVTLSAALRIVQGEICHGRAAETVPIARAIVAQLTKPGELQQ